MSSPGADGKDRFRPNGDPRRRRWRQPGGHQTASNAPGDLPAITAAGRFSLVRTTSLPIVSAIHPIKSASAANWMSPVTSRGSRSSSISSAEKKWQLSRTSPAWNDSRGEAVCRHARASSARIGRSAASLSIVNVKLGAMRRSASRKCCQSATDVPGTRISLSDPSHLKSDAICAQSTRSRTIARAGQAMSPFHPQVDDRQRCCQPSCRS